MHCDGSQTLFNNTQRPARNPEIAQNPSTNIRSPNSVTPPNGVFNRFGSGDDDDNSPGGDSAVMQSVAVCFVFIWPELCLFLRRFFFCPVAFKNLFTEIINKSGLSQSI